MDKTLKAILIIILIAIITVGVAYAYVTSLSGDQIATVTSIDILLDDTPLEHGDTIDWGEIGLGETWYANLSVTNNSPGTVIITFHMPGLPAGWTQTWDANGTALTSGASAWGWLNLTASTLGSETWGWNITAT